MKTIPILLLCAAAFIASAQPGVSRGTVLPFPSTAEATTGELGANILSRIGGMKMRSIKLDKAWKFRDDPSIV
jgi:hypothetical protein